MSHASNSPMRDAGDAFHSHIQSLVSSEASTSRHPLDTVLDDFDKVFPLSSRGKAAQPVNIEELLNDASMPFADEVDPLRAVSPWSPLATRNTASSSPRESALTWLRSKVPTHTPLDALTALLADSKRSNEDISSELLDLIGFEAIDSLPEILAKREEIARETASAAQVANTSNVIDKLHVSTISQAATPDESDAEGITNGNVGRNGKKQRNKHRQDGRPKEIKFSLTSGKSIEELEQMHLQKLEDAANRPLISNDHERIAEQNVRYPHVYANQSASSASSLFGSKVLLPLGTTKEEKDNYTEVTIPTPPKHPSAYTTKLLPIATLPVLLRRSFPYETLNRLQSLVYPTAYETSENMLVCAPTGAGKTDVAVLTILRALSMYADIRLEDNKMRNTEFKIVYVAPMKALASEIVKKMQKRFNWCGLIVKELTGDMQLTRQEIAETQMIVTTPEKWDVVTRKQTGEGELASRLRLLIIDEVHLLHEDRGAVLESIVARTLRQVESSQTLIRIVGLSATLPNYVDVADFLRVNPYVGLFFFDSSFRPVPLEQHFIAAKGKPNSQVSKDNLDRAAFDKTLDLVKDGHQVLIFVHARKDTVKTALMIKEKAMEESEMEWFDTKENPALDAFRRDLQLSRNREMKELVDAGIGIHHAGMLRSDRNISERLFEKNVTKVLVCTATLAWGVNLPAYAVIIKGTQLYDSSKGQFMDLSVLDVLQMFGRAGRPQYETHGVSYICTTSDKVDHYITAVNQQVPIESKFTEGLVDSLNAEISLGTVSTVDEGVRWLGYTFLHVRMRKNPMVYGLSSADLFSDPALGNRRRELIMNAAKVLSKNGMIQYDEDLGTLAPIDLGQISSKYYIRTKSIETFNEIFRAKATEADLLAVLSKSSEFQQVAVRESEADELKRLIENVIPCQVKGGTDTSDGKANVLLQAYISKAQVEDFALISDMAYVAQNAARIARALLEIAMSRKWSQATASLLSICKAIEKRLWPWSHPLEQVSLQRDILYNLNRWAEDMTLDEMVLMSASELGKLIHLNERLGDVALTAARQVPRLAIKYSLKPLSHDILRVQLDVSTDFKWSEKMHGRAQYFWVWLSDQEDRDILQISRVIVRENTRDLRVDFTIPLVDIPTRVHIQSASDSWFGGERTIEVDLSALVLPPKPSPPRKVLDIPYDLNDLHPDLLELVRSRADVLSALELQAMHTMFFSDASAVIAAPICDARYRLMSVALWRCIKAQKPSTSLVIAPSITSAKQVLRFLQQDLKLALQGHQVEFREGYRQSLVDTALRSSVTKSTRIIVTTPTAMSHLFQAGSSWELPTFDLVLADGLDELTPRYELVLSHILAGNGSTRTIGFSSPLLDSSDLARWLQTDPTHLYSFRPSARPLPIATVTTSFNLPHSPGLLKALVKPAYDAMRSHTGSSILFVPHRAQCYTTLTDLLTHSATDLNNNFRTMDEEVLEHYTSRITDAKIAEGLLHGFAVLSEGMHPADQAVTKHLYASGAIRVLIVPREACQTLDLTGNIVIVMGTQYAAFDPDSKERRILDYPMGDILRMQTRAAPSSQNESAQFSIFTQPDAAAFIQRFISEGAPLESSLLGSTDLFQAVLSRFVSGEIVSRQSCVDALATTFLSLRVSSNPSYYGQDTSNRAQGLSRIVDDLIEECRLKCLLRVKEDGTFKPTVFASEVARLRIGPRDLDSMMGCDEQMAIKLGEKVKVSSKITQSGLEGFLKKLPRSLQRKVGYGVQSNKNEEEESTEKMIVSPEGELNAGRALILTFLAKKLPPEGSVLETEQARLAVELLKRTMEGGT